MSERDIIDIYGWCPTCGGDEEHATRCPHPAGQALLADGDLDAGDGAP